MKAFGGYPVKSGFRGDGWELEDCVHLAREHPATFEVPSSAEAALVQIGDLLRLHFLITDPNIVSDPETPRAERMWVEVCGEAEAGVFRGHLTNTPVFIGSLALGDVIEFRWAHVAQVFVKDNDPRHPSGHA